MIYFLIFYLLFLVVYGVFSVAILYHLTRFGYKGSASSLMIIFYLAISIGIIVGTFILFFATGSTPFQSIDLGL